MKTDADDQPLLAEVFSLRAALREAMELIDQLSEQIDQMDQMDSRPPAVQPPGLNERQNAVGPIAEEKDGMEGRAGLAGLFSIFSPPPDSPPMVLLRKPDRRSLLKNRPREFQQAVMDYLEGTGTSDRHTFRETVAWLKTQSVATSISSLREFRDWWHEGHQLGAEGGDAARYVGRVCQRVRDIGLSEDQLLRIGQAFLEEMAAHDQDARLFNSMARLRQRDRALELRQRSIALRNEAAQRRAALDGRIADLLARKLELASSRLQSRPAPRRRRQALPEAAES